MKKINPHKILISFDVNGNFIDGIIMYQTTNDAGTMNIKYKTISFKSEMNIPIMNGIINKAIKFAEKQEN